MGMIDRTWCWRNWYIDTVGSLTSEFSLGVAIRFHNDPLYPYGKSVSLYVAWWCVTIGYEAEGATNAD